MTDWEGSGIAAAGPATGLITLSKAKNLLKIDNEDLTVDCLEIFHAAVGGVISASVEVTATKLVLTDNITGVNNFTLSTYPLISALVTAVQTAIPNWDIQAILLPDGDSADLAVAAVESCYLEVNTVALSIVNIWLIEQLIAGVSASAERICNRVFTATDYLEYHDGNGEEKLLLENFPIIEVYWVASNSTYGMQVSNTSITASRATVRVTTSTLELSVVIAGTETTNSLAFVTYPLISDMVAAIIAAGNGWDAASLVTIATPSTDLIPSGGFSCLIHSATLAIPLTYLSSYAIYNDEGYLRRMSLWPEGERNIIVKYRGGFATIPEDLQKIVAKEIGLQYINVKRNLTLKSETLGDYKWVSATISTSEHFEEELNLFLGRRFE